MDAFEVCDKYVRRWGTYYNIRDTVRAVCEGNSRLVHIFFQTQVLSVYTLFYSTTVTKPAKRATVDKLPLLLSPRSGQLYYI